ncbi:hypothetical protein TNCV_5104821 [Trichonephila clavipes]|nr:hypothetical protein TNCV_5104821 [Trichonephila clavipes]
MALILEKVQCVLWFLETNSPINVQRRFRHRYGHPGAKSVKRWHSMFNKIGSVTEDTLMNTWWEQEYYLDILRLAI